ncbi:hypothetical protein [Nocardioides montaniterrae]
MPSTHRTALRAVTVTAALLLTTTACSGGGSAGKGGADASKPLTIPITIHGDTISPNGTRIDAVVGQKIVLDVTTDVAQEIHVHTGGDGLPIEAAKGHHTYHFSVDRPGQIEVEVEDLHKTLFQLEVQPQ